MSANSTPISDPPENLRAREAYFTASQHQLIWARFKKQRAALVAAMVLVVLIIAGLFAPFLSPYDPTMAGRNKDYLNGAPNVPMFCDKNGCSVRPFLHTIERERSIKTNFRWVEKINDEKRRYVQFFVTGSEFRLLGLVPSDRVSHFRRPILPFAVERSGDLVASVLGRSRRNIAFETTLV